MVISADDLRKMDLESRRRDLAAFSDTSIKMPLTGYTEGCVVHLDWPPDVAQDKEQA